VAKLTPEEWAQAWEKLGKTKEDRDMNYVSDCCSALAVEGTLNTWHDYSGDTGTIAEANEVLYGTCSKCKEKSLFSEGE